MIVIRRFVRSFLLASGLFLAISVVAVAGLMYGSYRLSLESSGSSEASNVATIIAHNYGVGDLVSMRATLESLAVGRGWVWAQFSDIDGTVHWDIRESAGFGRTSTPEVDTSNVLYSQADVTNPSTGQKLGSFVLARNITGDRMGLMRELGVVIGAFLAFWLSFLGIIWWRARQAIVPIANMANSIRSRAAELSLDLRPTPGKDELAQISDWFQLLGDEWRAASQRALDNERLASVARTTTMLAHDIRRPFSTLKVGLDRLAAAGDNPTAVRELVQKIRDHVGKAFDQVNGLITDLMEISGEDTRLSQEVVDLPDMISTVISQIFHHEESLDIAFRYELKHTGKLFVDTLKLQRVLSNILENAKQAMNGSGTIWVATKSLSHSGGDAMEIVIGNDGPAIAREDLDQLFRAFFTKGKRGGTGLGLAICHKIIVAHGGSIECRSSIEGGTEFVLTLPTVGTGPCIVPPSLPLSSAEVRAAYISRSTPSSATAPVDPTLAEARTKIIDRAKALGRTINVLIVEDESVYAEGIKSILSSASDVATVVDVKLATNYNAALDLIVKQSFDLVISDVDLGKMSLSGFELVRQIRSIAPQSRICIHSNRSLASDYRTAIDCGADALLPKPMSPAHLLGLLLPQAEHDGPSAKAQATRPVAERPAQVVVVDDDVFILEAWQQILAGYHLHTFEHPEAVLDALERGDLSANAVDTVITDYYFDNAPNTTGLELARRLRAHGFRRIVAVTDERSARTATEFAAVLGKDEISSDLDMRQIFG